MLTWERLKELLDYNPDTGICTWKVGNRRSVKAGDNVGCLNGYGYIQTILDGKHYKVHRLIWFFVYGKFPNNFVDHRNGIRNDNRLANLREANYRENNSNRKSHREGGIIGTHFHRKTKKWQARIVINGKRKSLGLYFTQELASQAYQAALSTLTC